MILNKCGVHKKGRKILIIIIASILLLLSGVLIYLSVSANQLKGVIEDELSYQLELNCEIRGKIQARIIPDIRLKINDIHFDNGEEDILWSEQVILTVPFSFLFDDVVEIKQLDLIGPSMKVWYGEGGKSNWDLIGFDDKGIPDTNELDYSINLKKVTVSKGSILFRDLVYGDTLELHNISLSSDSMTFTGTQDGIDWNASSFLGSLKAEKFRFNRFTFKDLDFYARGERKQINIYYVSENHFGGSDEGNILINLRQSPLSCNFEHRMSDFRIEGLLENLGMDTLFYGTMDFSTELRFHAGGSNIFETMNGFISLEGYDLSLQGYDIDEFLAKFAKSQRFNLVDVGALLVAGPVGPVVTKGYDFARLLKPNKSDSSYISGFKSYWEIKDGVAIASDVCIATSQNRLAARGNINFAHSSFDGFEIAVLNEYGCASVSQSINGSFADPKTKGVSKVGALLGPVKNFFKGIFKKKKNCPRFYEGTIAHPEKQ